MSNLNEIMWRNQGQVLTPELIHGILSGAAYKPFRGIDVAQFEPVEYKGFTFQAERFADVVSELAPLHRMQWREVDERLQFLPFNPNYDKYIEQDRDGGLIKFTIRKDGAFDAETSYFSDGKIKSRSPRPKNHIWNNEAQDWREKSHHELYSDASDNIKIQRRYLLGMSDLTQLPDVPLATKEAWATYRQALRDITDQPGYPLDIVWPSPPIN